MIDFNDEGQVAIFRERCFSDFLFYVQFMFKLNKGFNFVLNSHHITIARELMRVYLGYEKRLIFNMPPQTGKTELIVVMFVSWAFARNPMCRFLHLSSQKDLVLDNSYKIKEIMQLPAYQTSFGVDFKYDKNSKMQWNTNFGGGFYASSTGGQTLGNPAGVMGYVDGFSGGLIIDDALKTEDKYSLTKVAVANRRVHQVILSRLAIPEITPVIIVQQRLIENDPTGYVLSELENEGWKLVKIPAINEQGESFFPFKYSTQKLLDIKEKSPWYFASEFMQEPAPMEGAIFKLEYWQYYGVLPKIEWMCILMDTAQKKGETNDYSVFACWGYAGGRIYLIEIMREKMEAPELEIRAKAFYDKYKNSSNPSLSSAKVRWVYIEDKVSGTGLIQSLQRKGGLPIMAIQRNIDKITRAHDSVGQIAAGNVFLPRSAPWLSDFLTEHANFPNAAHDDQVDTTSDAVDKMLNNKNNKVKMSIIG